MKSQKKIVIRMVKSDDAQKLYTLVDSSRKSIGQYLPWVDDTQSAIDEAKFINYALSQNELKRLYPYVILWDGEIAGMIDLHNVDHLNKKGYVGYWLGDSFVGKGIVHQALELLSDIAFQQLKLHKIIIQAEENNPRSIHVAQKAQFKLEGKSIDEVFFHDQYHTFLNYYLLDSD